MSKKTRDLVWNKKSGKMTSPKILKVREEHDGSALAPQDPAVMPADEMGLFQKKFEDAIKKAIHRK